METAQFEAHVRRRENVAVIELTGEIAGPAEEALEAAYGEAEDAPAILLEFSRVGYINSTGIALIVGVLAKARARRQEVTACGLSDHYREIFEITRLSDFMKVFSDEESAIGEATQGRE